MEKIRFFTKAQLIAANREAIASGRNRTLVPEMLEALPDNNFPVLTCFMHNDVEMRCPMVLDESGAIAVLDVPLEMYNCLPVAVRHDDGSVEFPEPAPESVLVADRLPLPSDMPNRGVIGSHVVEALGEDRVQELPLVSEAPDEEVELETVQAYQAYKCAECEEISEEVGPQLYECGDCGTKFNRDNSADGASHRCPDCSRFAAKLADQSCSECQEGEVEEITAYECPSCDKLHEEEEDARNCCLVESTADEDSKAERRAMGVT